MHFANHPRVWESELGSKKNCGIPSNQEIHTVIPLRNYFLKNKNAPNKINLGKPRKEQICIDRMTY